MSDPKQSRLNQQFLQLLDKLIENQAINEQVARNMPMPSSADEIVPRLWEAGVDDIKLATAMADLFKRALFNGMIRDRDSIVRSSNDRCPWLIADSVLYVSNPYDRAQIEPLL